MPCLHLRPDRALSVAALCLMVLLCALAASSASAQAPSSRAQSGSHGRGDADLTAAVNQLPPKYRQWVQSVAGLITRPELDYFLALVQDYQRDRFMDDFWTPRDPDPKTPGNEMRQRWQGLLDGAGGIAYSDPRYLVYLVSGSPGGLTLPNGQAVARCFSKTWELEIWFYRRDHNRKRDLPIIFLQRSPQAPYEAYLQGDVLRPIRRHGKLPTTDIRLLCADDNLRYVLGEIGRLTRYEELLQQALTPPSPSPEWLSTLSASGTEAPPGAESFDAHFQLTYPGRNQSRTAVQMQIEISRDDAPGREFDDQSFHNFLLHGEVIRDGKLFESFSYRFEGATPDGTTSIPLGFTRFLRPGPARLRILVEDIYSGRFAQAILEIKVPTAQDLPSIRKTATPDDRPQGPSLKLLTPPGGPLSGLVRFTARPNGSFDKVTFFVDDKAQLHRRRPPYTAELQLGKSVEPHRIRVVGFIGDREVATDQIWINQGAQRFRVLLIEPRDGGIYPGSLTARVEVQTPDGRPPESVEVYLNDRLLATLASPPYQHLVQLEGPEAAVVRAVAQLADGATAEDAALINGSGFGEVLDVRLVELQVLVTDNQGIPIHGLGADDFQLFEDSVKQKVARFEEAAEAPVHVALLIDRSASMKPHLDLVTAAAGSFATDALRSPEDRVTVLSFADDVSVDTGFTASTAQVERALAGLVATGSTALYDSLDRTLGSFDGIRGHNALLLFTDGRDEGSRRDFDQLLETAKRSGAPIYVIALAEAFAEKDDRRPLEQLAGETGGRTVFIDNLEDLEAEFASVLAELRSRYLLAYEPSARRSSSDFRKLEVQVDIDKARIRTRRGYYP